MTPFSANTISQTRTGFQAQLLTRPPRLILIFCVLVFLMTTVVVASLIIVEWRQTVVGQGEVSIYDPFDRPQNIDAQIKGRLVDLMVKEGDMVEKGQVITHLEDRDSKFLDPLQSDRLSAQISALEQKKFAAIERIGALEQQQGAIEQARLAKRASAEAKIQQCKQKAVVTEQLLVVGKQDVETAKLQEERIIKLQEAGLKSRRDLELTLQKRVQAETKLQKMQGDVLLAQREIDLASLEIAKIDAEASEKNQKSAESIAKARESIAEIDEKIQKLSNEMGALQVRRSLRTIVAPRDGRIVNLKKLGPGQLVKEGQTIATIVPEDHRRGVELYLTGIDAPLVQKGVKVRLMFEGFPAVPFAGWDWASVGTFGGTVASVDPTPTEGDKSGFRVWVLPDENDEPWPEETFLRIGSKARGWLMLRKVPLYYELWRQLNAFPAKPIKKGDKVKTKPVIRR